MIKQVEAAVHRGLKQNSAGIPDTLLLRIEAVGFPTFVELLL